MPQVIRTSAFFRRSTPGPARTIRASLFIDERPIHLGSRSARDDDWSTQKEQTWLVLAERYLAVHHGPVRCLFYSQCPTGKFRPLSHYS